MEHECAGLTHALSANIAQMTENNTNEAICAAIPAKKMFPPAWAVLILSAMESPPPAAWMRNVATDYQNGYPDSSFIHSVVFVKEYGCETRLQGILRTVRDDKCPADCSWFKRTDVLRCVEMLNNPSEEDVVSCQKRARLQVNPGSSPLFLPSILSNFHLFHVLAGDWTRHSESTHR